MDIELIAATDLASSVVKRKLGYFTAFANSDETAADVLAEFAGRACYQSWHKPNPLTRSNEGYLANIREQAHFSVLEHASASFYIQGISRSLTHELIRHRHISPSQLSQRFVDESGAAYVIPPMFEGDEEAEHILADAWHDAQNYYASLVAHAEEQYVCTRKEAREAARAVLPNMCETKIVLTGNHRAWRELIVKRNDPHADAEIQRLAKGILVHLKRVAPNSYADMEP